MEKDKTLLVKPIVGAIIIILILAYIVSVVLKANFTQIKTETATIMTVSESVSAKGYFIRDEHLISYNEGGFVSYIIDDGDKISKNEAVANVFSDAEAAAEKNQADKLEIQIKKLEQLEKTKEAISATPDELDKTIDNDLSKINQYISDRDYASVQNICDNMLYSLNERQLVTGKTEGYDAKINDLRSQLDALKNDAASKTQKSISSPATGYFVSSADGYENIDTTADIDKLMPGDLAEDKLSKKDVSADVIGKTIEGVSWYVACDVSAEDALKIKSSDELHIELPLVNNELISVKLYSINQKTKTSDAVVILQGDFMNKEMAQVRSEDISIVVNTYTGIYISKKAVHERELSKKVTDNNGKTVEVKENVTGVFIKLGNELKFKQIIPIYTGEDFVVCKKDLSDSDKVFDRDAGILKPYDNVVVEGANLYDNKIIDRTN